MDSLLQDLKDKLNITWDEEDTDCICSSIPSNLLNFCHLFQIKIQLSILSIFIYIDDVIQCIFNCYFVFNKKEFDRSGKSKLDYNYYYQVHIIMENYIPEGFEQKVIKAIQDNTRLKLTDQSMQFYYITKNNTDMVVEMLTLEFTRAFKEYNLLWLE